MAVIQITLGQIIARVDSIGSSLIGLTDGNFNLIEPNTPSDLYPGSVLAPWPNRIRDGRYQHNQLVYQLPINEKLRGNALHGLVAYEQWKVIFQADNEVRLQYLLDLPEIYPGKLLLKSTFKIEDKKLKIEITAKNVGSKGAPYGVSIHTYLLAGRLIKNNNLSLKIPADKYLAVDESNLLPLELKNVLNTEFDFQNGKVISDLFIDHAFRYAKNQPRIIELLNQAGEGAVMEFDELTNWIQIHTADRDQGENSRITVAVEPMSCPPDAFNSNIDLVELLPENENHFEVKIWRKQRV